MFFHEPPRQQLHPHYYPYPPFPNQPRYEGPYQQQVPFQGYAPPPPPHQGAYQQQPQSPYQQQLPYQQQKPASKFMTAFQSSEGKFDFQKTMTTMDQVVKTANQVTPIVKQVGSYFIKK